MKSYLFVPFPVFVCILSGRALDTLLVTSVSFLLSLGTPFSSHFPFPISPCFLSVPFFCFVVSSLHASCIQWALVVVESVLRVVCDFNS